MRIRRAVTTAVILTLLASRAVADPALPAPAPTVVTPDLTAPVHLHSDATCTTAGGSSLTLPPGYFLAEPVWTKFDTTTKTLQDTDTEITAENKSLRASAAGWQPGWYTLGTVLVSAFIAGIYVRGKL
jgi:hypothetical protein